MKPITFIFGIVWIIEQTITILSLKYLFSKLQFDYPIFVTCIHMIFSFILSATCILFLIVLNKLFYPSNDTSKKIWTRKSIKWRTIFTKIHFLSILNIISIVCGNMSMGFIPIVFIQMMGALRTPLTGILANIIRKTTFSQNTWILTYSMAFGIFIVTTKQFDSINAKNIGIFVLGIFISFTSIITGGLKTVLSKIVLSDKQENPDSLSMLMYMSPFGFIYLLILFMIVEKNRLSDVSNSHDIDNNNNNMQDIIFMIIFTSFMSFVFNVFNIVLLRMVNEITFQIMGLIRIVIVIICSGYLFNESIGFLQIVGIIFVLSCSFWYFYIKYESHIVQKNNEEYNKLMDEIQMAK